MAASLSCFLGRAPRASDKYEEYPGSPDRVGVDGVFSGELVAMTKTCRSPASPAASGLNPACRPARPPSTSPPAPRSDTAALTRRKALAASPDFSILLDVRRPGDGPGVDLARWGCVASRRSGTARLHVSPGAALEGIGACVVWLRHTRVVAGVEQHGHRRRLAAVSRLVIPVVGV
jgi:hypothetical protein